MKTLYEMLKTELKSELDKSAKQYNSAERLKYTLMSKVLWHELTVGDVNDVLTYTNLSSYKMSAYDFMYGDNILIKDEQ